MYQADFSSSLDPEVVSGPDIILQTFLALIGKDESPEHLGDMLLFSVPLAKITLGSCIEPSDAL